MNQPNIETYLNYREFLTDCYAYQKSRNSSFSHRAFSLKAGLSSPSHFKMVADGSRNLSPKTLPKFVKGLSLDNQTASYFETLVYFNQAQDNESRSNYFKKLIDLRSKKNTSTSLEDSSFEFLSNWFTVAIYVLIGTQYFKDDIHWIIKKLNNKVSVTNIKKALSLMLELNLIKEDKEKGYVQSNGALSSAEDTRSIAVYNYHKQMNEIASECLDTVDGDLREFNGATISISVEDIPILKEKIRKFRKEINELTSNELKGKEVYQMNVQLFPLTSVEKH
ncbi:TIGR02147 family protein [Halobacteriovorax sp. GB3]|uniref:TIGR02147 family protein n=1 Tax=Halobacteriovorax sp. GB3 TaxID=2719615 RepID=UPI0023603597|nr:TIGR02147 family protein [Halobacteriovorax sp. GB3]MDD0852117.1 TIGR02147 family protein [Halobacteriovorax sp. GB3]